MHTLKFFVLCAVVSLISPGYLPGAEVPAELQTPLDAALEQYGNSIKEAEEKLLASFEKEIEFTRKRPLNAEARQEVIDALVTERTTFEKHGTIPFSPRMSVIGRLKTGSSSLLVNEALRTRDRPTSRAEPDCFTKGPR